jgi:hypothetical protein
LQLQCVLIFFFSHHFPSLTLTWVILFRSSDFAHHCLISWLYFSFLVLSPLLMRTLFGLPWPPGERLMEQHRTAEEYVLHGMRDRHNSQWQISQLAWERRQLWMFGWCWMLYPLIYFSAISWDTGEGILREAFPTIAWVVHFLIIFILL